MKTLSIPATFFTALLLAAVPAPAADTSQPWLMNPPPAEKFSSFTRFEMPNIAMFPPYAGKGPNVKALTVIQRDFTKATAPALQAWNEAGAKAEKVRTLLIEPRVEEIKFISGGTRFWAGGLAGDSFVRITIKISEKETGRVIGTPMFYAKANRMAGAWSVGATDNVMLTRVAAHMAAYVTGNYAAAVGGATGEDPPKK
jgi:hypothetical protein